MEIKICHLYPDALNLYGDRGNILCMKQRLLWRGIGCEVGSVGIEEHLDPAGYDIFFIGGGQDFEQEVLLSDLRAGKGPEIRAAIEDGKTFLCICGGYQILGNEYVTQDGVKCEFLGAIDFSTIGDSKRLIGNYAFELEEEAEEDRGKNDVPPDPPGVRPAGFGNGNSVRRKRKNSVCEKREKNSGRIVVGFENHSGRTFLGSGVQPLGRILKGSGNNGKDKTEGVRCKNVFGTYSHGPVLPKNPVLCDRILQCALERRYGRAGLEPLDDRFEEEAHEQALAEVLGRKRLLRNIGQTGAGLI